MKIVFFNDLIYAYATEASSAVGGAERQQWLLARALAAAGWQVKVGVRYAQPPNQRAFIEGVEFIAVSQKQFLRAWCCFIVAERPDWCYWRCATHLLGPIVALAKIAGVRTIFSTAFDRDVKIRHALFRRPGWWPLYALGLLWTDKIFVQNENQLFGLPRRLRGKAFIIRSITTETQAAKPHSMRPKYVAWVAMLRQSKRPDLLVEIARKASDIHFVVCGGLTTFTAAPGYGEEIADTLRALPNVDYRGQVSPNEALHVMADAALFLSTSEEEGFPNTFLQAWSAGTPVVSLRVDPDHVVERYGLGKISLSVQKAIVDLRALLDSAKERENISFRAREYVAEHHYASAVISSFESSIRCEIPEFSEQSRTGQLI